MGRRRNIRRSGGGGGGGSGGVGGAPPRDPLMLDYWQSNNGGVQLVGGAADTWNGGINGSALPFVFQTARPAFGLDGTNFNGKPVVQCSQAGVAVMRLFTGATLLASGTRPHFYLIARQRALLGTGEYRLLGFGISGGANVGGTWNDSGFPANRYGHPGASPGNINGPAPDTLVARYMLWSDGVNANFQTNGVLGTLPSALSLAVNVNAIALGCNAPFLGERADASIAFLAVFTAKPSNAYLAKLDAWALPYYGL